MVATRLDDGGWVQQSEGGCPALRGVAPLDVWTWLRQRTWIRIHLCFTMAYAAMQTLLDYITLSYKTGILPDIWFSYLVQWQIHHICCRIANPWFHILCTCSWFHDLWTEQMQALCIRNSEHDGWKYLLSSPQSPSYHHRYLQHLHPKTLYLVLVLEYKSSTVSKYLHLRPNYLYSCLHLRPKYFVPETRVLCTWDQSTWTWNWSTWNISVTISHW